MDTTERTRFLKAVPLFEGLSDAELNELAAACIERAFTPDEHVVVQGRTGLGFFMISDGLVDVLKDGQGVAQLGEGAFFGEVSLLTDEPRSATIIARQPTDCLVLLNWDFRELLAKKPEISVKLLEVVCRRLADLPDEGRAPNGTGMGRRSSDMGPVDFLKRVPLFEGLTEEEITELALAAQERDFSEGAFIVTQGSPGLGFYLLVDGKVQVLRNRKAVAELGPGGFFGEMSLLDESPRSASIVALEPCKCLVLGSWDFRVLLKKKPEIGIKMLEVMSKRLRETNEKVGLD